jgi:MoaA/NifB/PqqE/SkfB family radical SAM enzyme
MALPHMAAVLRPLKHLRVRAGCLSGLEFLWLEITRRCNLSCLHCYADSGPQLPLSDRMTVADWCRVMDEARAADCRRLQFIGGEPTLHPQLPELLEHAASAGFRTVEVFTNATLIRDPLLRTVKRLGVHVRFSFYSHEAAVHDDICGQPGSYERTIEGVGHLVRHGVHLTAGIIVVPQNAGHEAETTRLLRRLGVRRIGVDRVRGVGRGERFAAGTTPENELCGQCWKGTLCVDTSGDAHPCVFARGTTVGNVFAAPIDAIVAGARLQAFRRDMYFGAQGG